MFECVHAAIPRFWSLDPVVRAEMMRIAHDVTHEEAWSIRHMHVTLFQPMSDGEIAELALN